MTILLFSMVSIQENFIFNTQYMTNTTITVTESADFGSILDNSTTRRPQCPQGPQDPQAREAKLSTEFEFGNLVH